MPHGPGRSVDGVRWLDRQTGSSREATIASHPQGLVALTLALTTACTARSDVTVKQLQDRSEQIGQSLTAAIEGVERYQDDYAGGELRWENAEVNDGDPTG